jgi:hypothetical protein
MQIVTMMGQMFESGKVTLSTKNNENIEIKAVNKKIDVNATNKELIRDIISILQNKGKDISVLEKAKESFKTIRAAKSTRDMMIDIAEELKTEGITITFSYQGNVIATIGALAAAKVSRLVTGSKAIQINSLLKLVELGL